MTILVPELAVSELQPCSAKIRLQIPIAMRGLRMALQTTGLTVIGMNCDMGIVNI